MEVTKLPAHIKINRIDATGQTEVSCRCGAKTLFEPKQFRVFVDFEKNFLPMHAACPLEWAHETHAALVERAILVDEATGDVVLRYPADPEASGTARAPGGTCAIICRRADWDPITFDPIQARGLVGLRADDPIFDYSVDGFVKVVLERSRDVLARMIEGKTAVVELLRDNTQPKAPLTVRMAHGRSSFICYRGAADHVADDVYAAVWKIAHLYAGDRP